MSNTRNQGWSHRFAESLGFQVDEDVAKYLLPYLEDIKRLCGARYCPNKYCNNKRNCPHNVCPCSALRRHGECECGLFYRE